MKKLKFFIFKLIHKRKLNITISDTDKRIFYTNIIEVKGWRTCLIDNYSGQRSTITFMFWFDGIWDEKVRPYYKIYNFYK